MYEAHGKAGSITVPLTGSQISYFHTQKNCQVFLLVYYSYMREFCGGDHKYNFCQPIRWGVSDEVIRTVEFRGMRRQNGKMKADRHFWKLPCMKKLERWGALKRKKQIASWWAHQWANTGSLTAAFKASSSTGEMNPWELKPFECICRLSTPRPENAAHSLALPPFAMNLPEQLRCETAW